MAQSCPGLTTIIVEVRPLHFISRLQTSIFTAINQKTKLEKYIFEITFRLD